MTDLAQAIIWICAGLQVGLLAAALYHTRAHHLRDARRRADLDAAARTAGDALTALPEWQQSSQVVGFLLWLSETPTVPAEVRQHAKDLVQIERAAVHAMVGRIGTVH